MARVEHHPAVHEVAPGWKWIPAECAYTWWDGEQFTTWARWVDDHWEYFGWRAAPDSPPLAQWPAEPGPRREALEVNADAGATQWWLEHLTARPDPALPR